jgi:hypothetical protein
MKNGRCKFHGGLSTGPRTPEGLHPPRGPQIVWKRCRRSPGCEAVASSSASRAVIASQGRWILSANLQFGTLEGKERLDVIAAIASCPTSQAFALDGRHAHLLHGIVLIAESFALARKTSVAPPDKETNRGGANKIATVPERR